MIDRLLFFLLNAPLRFRSEMRPKLSFLYKSVL